MCLGFTSTKKARAGAKPTDPVRQLYVTRLPNGRCAWVARKRTAEEADARPEDGLRVGGPEFNRRLQKVLKGEKRPAAAAPVAPAEPEKVPEAPVAENVDGAT